MKLKKVQKQARTKSEKRYKGYFKDYRLVELVSKVCGFARVGISFSYRQTKDVIFDKREEKVQFLYWIENYKKMIKTKKYNLPIKYDDLQVNQRRAVRLQYMKEQNMLCQYCNFPLNENPSHTVKITAISWDDFPVKFQNHPIHLHHDHKTGMTLGAVHMKCNAYLWQYKKE